MSREERKEKSNFQSFNKPKIKITRESAAGKDYVDYKDTESLRRCLSNNGKILSRKRTGANAMEQRMLSQALKRARFMSLLPYTTTSI
jgi:small subunit ribosomal protein S18